MRHLIRKADVITPNMTELFYLLDKPYKAENTDEELKAYLHEIFELARPARDRCKTSVYAASWKSTGTVQEIVWTGNFQNGRYAYDRQGNRYWKVTCPYLPAHYPGTGDTFTSVITGSLMQGDSLPIALDRATQFILQGIRATFGYEYDNRAWRRCCITCENSIRIFRL